MSKTERKLSAISLILVAVMVFTAVFNVIYVGNVASAKVPNNAQTSVGNNSGFVKSDMNFDSIREQYINHELVEKNTASYDGDRWVIVELESGTLYDAFKKSTRYSDFSEYSASAEAQRVQASIKVDQSNFLSRLERHGIDYQLKYTYSAITNALAIKINAEAYNAIRKMSGVSDIYYTEYYDVPKVVVENNANVYTTGIYNTDGIKDYHGEGMVVAILDTGLDSTHEAFQTMPADGGRLKKSDIQSAVEATYNGGKKKLLAEGTADDFYYNEKVPFAYDYADGDPNVYPAYSSHGTHVAGIVAGKSDYVVSDENGRKETFKGVAPEAQLVICKVFTDNLDSEILGGANTMGILAALNDCAVLGVDAINMSLGSSAGFTDENGDDANTRFLNKVYGTIESMGISLVVAASNDYSSGFGGGNGTNLASNPDSGTVGSPSTYSAALSVASINGRKSSYVLANDSEDQVAFINNSSNEFGQEFDFIDQLYKIAAETRGVASIAKGQPLRFKYVTIGGYGGPSDYSSNLRREITNKSGYDGVIVLVKRGNTTFAEKVEVAKGLGAQACIIYNNVAGTIKMSLGELENPIPACSISMDAGEVIARKKVGVINVNSSYEAGPFMSEFSSWGPTPNLQLKPEITAHGGEILSAVPGGYDKQSGTSMASPNMAGAVALLRQHLQTVNPDISGKELNSLVNQTLMSTATIAKNENNNPYSPRKQGAGLADIASAINAEGYILVPDGQGNYKDKTKIELYDTAKKTGVYTLDFVISNITNSIQTYNPVTYVMTETMSSDGKTVAEKAYMLNDKCTIQYSVGSNLTDLKPSNGAITVNAKSDLAVRVVIVLNDEAKKYLDDNFKNGMYVEGFVSMQATGGTSVTLGVPYLGFYGDWTAAPLFDYDVYEIAEDEKNPSLDEYTRKKASSAATMAVGMYYEDQYILPLGSYIYAQDEDEVEVYPEREKIAISMFDDDRGHTIYELYMVYAGLLRGAKEMDIVITDDATGEIIYRETASNVRKSYAGGGANRGSAIMLEINPAEWGLANNSSYSVSLAGRLDYEGGENPDRATWEFPFTVDYEEPSMVGYKIRYMPYKDQNNTTQYRIFMDVDVRDNQYVSTVLPCYIKTRPTGYGTTEDVLTLLTEYPIPVNSQKGEATTVTFEVTDVYEEYVKTGKLYLQVEDYALNSANYRIVPGVAEGENAMSDPESVEFVTDENLKKTGEYKDSLGTKYFTYSLVLPSYTLYNFNAITKPDEISLKSLTWEYEGNRVKAQDDQLFTGAGGRATLKLTNTTMLASAKKTYAIVEVLIAGSDGASRIPTLNGIQLNAALNGSGNATSLKPTDGSTPELELNPNQSLKLTWNWSPWYCDKPDVEWTSSKPDVVSVSEDGTIKALKENDYSYIRVKAIDKPTVTASVKVTVGRDYRIVSFTLYDFYAEGEVEIPSDRNIMYLDEDCFKGNDKIEKVILPTTLMEIPENAFLGCTNLKEVVIPGQCTTIKANAFAGCTALTTVKLGLFVDSEKNELGEKYAGTLTIGRNAFKDCSSLTTITNQQRITAIYERAFENCKSLASIDISKVRVAANGAFKNSGLQTVIMSEDTAIGRGMFEGCTKLVNLTGESAFKGGEVSENMFSGCTGLTNIELATKLTHIGANAFKGTAIKNVKLPDGEIAIDANAFNGSALTTLTLSADTVLKFERNTPFAGCSGFTAYAIDGTSKFYDVQGGVLFNKDKTALISVPYALTSFTMPGSVTSIANGALSGVNVSSIDLSAVNSVGNYAFAGNTTITSVKLPSGLTEIPTGLFDGCTKLASVTADDNFANVTKVGENAFRKCSALTGVTMANVKEIGDRAFESSGITAVCSSLIEKIGIGAFAKTKLVNVSLDKTTTLGSNAFANIETLKTVVLGGITSMGNGVFDGSNEITSVTFGEGTTRIGYGAFMSDTDVNTAITVVLPNTVEYIDQYAFYHRKGLTAINLSGVKYVDQYAFAFTELSNADLSNVEQIGYGAFANAKFTSINLAKAWLVSESAFYNNNVLTSVTFGALKRIGAYAFFNSKLTSVELPASFNERVYNYEWCTYDENNIVEKERSRKELNYAPAAFSGILTLTEIRVADWNKSFFSKDGVLYSKVENGYILEQYPANKAGTEYTVIDNTVIISESAFEYTLNIEKVTFPYTVRTIGAYAFFQSNCTDYTFNSVKAPTLLATRITENDVDDALLKSAFGREIDKGGLGITNYYTNFKSYALNADPSVFTNAEDFKLTMTVPLNGKGYDGIWNLFFSTIKRTEKNMPDDTSYEAIAAIEKLPSLVDINKATEYGQVSPDSAYGKLATAARVAYNKIVLTEQIEVMESYYTILTNVEAALRAKKSEFGHTVKIKELKIVRDPDKLRYDIGESFDTTGMIIAAIYEDGSEVLLSGGNYTISPSTIDRNTKAVIITYRDELTGDEISETIAINVNIPDEPYEPTNPVTPQEKDKALSGGAIAGIVIGVILGLGAIAGAVVAVLLVKKKKSSGATASEGLEDKAPETAENETAKAETDAENAKIATAENSADEATADAQTDDVLNGDSNEAENSATEENGIIKDNDAAEIEKSADSEAISIEDVSNTDNTDNAVAEEENND